MKDLQSKTTENRKKKRRRLLSTSESKGEETEGNGQNENGEWDRSLKLQTPPDSKFLFNWTFFILFFCPGFNLAHYCIRTCVCFFVPTHTAKGIFSTCF